MSSVPTAANAGYYAEIVNEQAILRRLVEAGTRVVQMGYAAAAGSNADLPGSVDDIVDRAQAEMYDVTERRLVRGLRRHREAHHPGDGRDGTHRRQRAASAPASPPASSTWTASPTACTRGR